MRRLLPLGLAAVVLALASLPLVAAKSKGKPAGNLYAVFDPSLGKITVQLFEKQAPKTVANFVGLANGTKAWTDPKTRKKVKRPFYDGLSFHRVIPGFMIQGGCPYSKEPSLGRPGTGGPGYQFADEFHPSLRHDKPGRLSMANAGPNTNGSQFFITVAPTPHLDGRHSVFGQVVKGQSVVEAITKVSRDMNDCPLKPVVMKKVTIYRANAPK